VGVRPRLLDLCCGAGGTSVGYHRAGFEVVGVDIKPQPHYPFDFMQGDALLAFEMPGWLDTFDVIHTSPPCQGYSSKTFDRSPHPRLIGELRDRLARTGVPYVIENVEGARTHMVEPVTLCGSSFGLDVRRHRLFESNVPILGEPCRHAAQPPRHLVYDHGRWYLSRTVPVFGTGGGKAAEHWAAAMGIDWMTREELSQAIPPAYTEHIGQQLIAHLRSTVEARARLGIADITDT
jgi:DNA (cytosine-5)-methyltransferase 1